MSTGVPGENQPIPPAPDEPAWMQEFREFREELRQLPGKLRANITQEDRDGIAAGVHKWFEGSGAFERVTEEPPKNENDPVDDPDNNNPPAPPGKDEAPQQKDSLARRAFGRW